MEKITQLDAYLKLVKLFENNGSNSQIADLAFELYNGWSPENSKKSYDIIYDLALIEEPGMELTRKEIRELIDKLYDISLEANNVATKISSDFKTFAQFFSKLIPNSYTENEFNTIYQDLEEIYLLALVDCELEKNTLGNWEKYRLRAMESIKKIFMFNPYIFLT